MYNNHPGKVSLGNSKWFFLWYHYKEPSWDPLLVRVHVFSSSGTDLNTLRTLLLNEFADKNEQALNRGIPVQFFLLPPELRTFLC